MRLQCNNVREQPLASATIRCERLYIFEPGTMYGLDVDVIFEPATGHNSMAATPDGLLKPVDQRRRASVYMRYATNTAVNESITVDVWHPAARSSVLAQFQQELDTLLHAYYDSCAYFGCRLSHFIFSFYGP